MEAGLRKFNSPVEAFDAAEAERKADIMKDFKAMTRDLMRAVANGDHSAKLIAEIRKNVVAIKGIEAADEEFGLCER